MTTQLENTELSDELHEAHRGLKGCVRDERCGAVPLVWVLGTCTECKLQVEASLRTFGSMGIAGSELGRPALAGLSSLTTWVEETIAKAKLCGWVKAQVVASERSATTRAATSASSTIDAVERPTRLKEGTAESRVLLLPDALFERFKAICAVIQELYMYCTALVQQRWASMPEQADAAHAADSKEAHTDIHQALNVSHTGEEVKTNDSPVVQCGEGPCGAGGSAASARFDAGEVMRSTAADLHPCKKDRQPTPSHFPACQRQR